MYRLWSRRYLWRLKIRCIGMIILLWNMYAQIACIDITVS